MTDGVNVKLVEDDSVEIKLKKVALRLSKKYNKKRVINERLLRKRSLPRRIFDGVSSVLSVVLISFCIIFVGSTVFNKINNMPPSVAGFFSMQVASGSMENDGFFVGDNVIVRAVDTKTLEVGDIIAFYAHDANINVKTLTPNTEPANLKFKTTFAGFFGVLSPEIKAAAKQNTTLVFHHIKEVLEDNQGNRYFKTYGSSNLKKFQDENGNMVEEIAVDTWLISENMIVGSYDGSVGAKIASALINLITTPTGLMIVIFIPVVYIIFILMRNAFKNVQLAFLESDVVEEKRKLTDEICVKNDIGYRMNKKTKYKVLAQAPADKKLEYISLLWKTDNRPENIQKYYLRKGLILRPMQKLRDVNRNCELMFKEGVEPVKIAKYYTQEKEKIQDEQKRYNALVRKIGESYKAERNGEVEVATPQNAKYFKVTIKHMRGQLPKSTQNATNSANSTKKPTSKPKLAENSAKTATKKPKIAEIKPKKSASNKEPKETAKTSNSTAKTKQKNSVGNREPKETAKTTKTSKK